MHRPWHVRLAGFLAGLVTLAAAIDYVLTQYRIDAWLALFPPEQVRYSRGLPDLAELLWAVAVWAGLIGAFLLVGNRRRSAMMLAIAALSAIALAVLLCLGEPVPFQAVFGPGGTAILVGWAVALTGFWLYARRMHRQGVVR